MENSKVKFENYGDMLAKVKDMDLVIYEEAGSYQGDFLAVLKDKGILYFYIDSYGSCSGCDWLESEQGWGEDEGVEYKKALEYCEQIVLAAKMPETIWETLSNEQKEMLVQNSYDSADMKKTIVSF